MPIQVDSASGSITLTAEDGSGNANLTLPRAGLGDAATKTVGTAAGNIPLNSNLGTVATLDTGTAAGNIPVLDSSGQIADAQIAGVSASKLIGSLPAIDGSALTGVGGKVLQVVQYFTDSSTSISNPDGSEVIISQAFTPTSATSKVLMIGSFDVEKGSGADGYFTPATWRDSTYRGNPCVQVGRFDTAQRVHGHSWTYLDTPATTSEITYTIKMYSVWHAGTTWVFSKRALTLMEIGA